MEKRKTDSTFLFVGIGLALLFLYLYTQKNALAAPLPYPNIPVPEPTANPNPNFSLPKVGEPGSKIEAVSAIVGVLVALFLALRSTAHLTANDFVQHYQNVFAARLGELVDAKDRGLAEHTLTADDVRQYANAVSYLWEQFQQAANTYSLKSKDAATVVRQALFTLNGPMGDGVHANGLINTILADMERQANALA